MSDNQNLVIQVKLLRRAIGILGILFPFVLAIGAWLRGCDAMQHSISYYYHTNMGDFFVGFLCAFSMFLFAYNGQEKKDSRAGNVAGIFALGVVLFPTTFYTQEDECTMLPWFTNQFIHLTSAACFFLTLAYFSLFLFTKTKDDKPAVGQKKKRNNVYKTCGYVMIGCLALIVLYMLWLKNTIPSLQNLKPIFWLESFALIAFGVSWLTKGETIWKD